MAPATALALLFAGACRDGLPDGPTDLPLPSDIDSAELTLGFDDSPLEGELRIEAAAPSGWTYAVDLDEDGRPDEVGNLHIGVAIPYRYERSGLHRIRLTLEREGERRTLERLAVVNDPAATELVLRTTPDPFDRPDWRAIALDEAGERLFVVKADPDFTLFELDPTGLAERWRLPLPGERSEFGYQPTQGIALSGNTLFVDIGDSLIVVDVGDPPRVVGAVAEARWGDRLIGPRSGRLYSGGWNGVAVHDAITGAVITARDLEEFGDGLAVSPDESTIAYLHDVFLDPVLLLLDSGSLVERARVDLAGRGTPFAVTFHPEGDRAYVVTEGAAWRLLVVRLDELRIEKEAVLARGGSRTFSASHSLGWSRDGRYLVIGSPFGVFFVDSRIDHPRYRWTENPPFDTLGCCGVAISPADGRVFTSSGSRGEISIVRFLR